MKLFGEFQHEPAFEFHGQMHLILRVIQEYEKHKPMCDMCRRLED